MNKKDQKTKELILSSFTNSQKVVDGLLKQMEKNQTTFVEDMFTLYVIRKQLEDVVTTNIKGKKEAKDFLKLTKWFDGEVKRKQQELSNVKV